MDPINLAIGILIVSFQVAVLYIGYAVYGELDDDE